MIKKFVSDALLSVIMDKQARQKLKASRQAKAVKKSPRATDEKAQFASDPMPAPAPPMPEPTEIMGPDEINALIRDSLEAAEQEISEKKVRRAANPERQALIDQALAIQSSKRHIVDELPEEQRQKLIFMAQQALGAKLKGKK